MLVELRRVVRRAVATAEVEETQAGALLAAVARASARWTVLELTREVTDRVEGCFPREPLRTLTRSTSRVRWCCGTPSSTFACSASTTGSENAVLLGFDVLPVAVELAVV
jgi:hypothetical protein